MTGQQVDQFAAKLSEELRVLPREAQHELLVRIGKMEARMRADGQERPFWKNPVPRGELLGAEVVVQTDQGERRGRVIYYGISRVGPEYEVSAVVHSAASGTHVEAPGSAVRLASPGESERIREELEMAGRLKAASEEVVSKSQAKRLAVLTQARPKWAPDPQVAATLVDEAKTSSHVFNVYEVGGCWKVEGMNRDKRLYIHKKGLRVDASGFEPANHPALIKITAEDAKKAHLGKVRGQIDFRDIKSAKELFSRLLEQIAC